MVKHIAALPATVRWLEIDTKCHDRWDDSPDNNLCRKVADHLPHLEALRFRSAHVCPDILSPSETLVCLTINMLSPAAINDVQGFKDARAWPSDRTKKQRQSVGHKTRERLTAAALNAKTSYPPLSTFSIIDSTIPDVREKKQVHTVFRRDILRERCTAHPLLHVSNTGEVQHTNQVYHKTLRLPDALNIQEDVVGNIADIEELAEDSQWQTTINGTRLPTLIKNRPEGRRHVWGSPKTWLTEEEVLAGKGNLRVPLWSEESQAGRKLVKVQVVDDMSVSKVLELQEWKDQQQLDREAEERAAADRGYEEDMAMYAKQFEDFDEDDSEDDEIEHENEVAE